MVDPTDVELGGAGFGHGFEPLSEFVRGSALAGSPLICDMMSTLAPLPAPGTGISTTRSGTSSYSRRNAFVKMA